MAIRRSVGTRRVRSLAICHNALPHEPRRFDPALVRRFLHAVPAVVAHSDDESAVLTELGATHVSIARLPFFLPMVERQSKVDPRSRGRLLFFGFVRPYKGLDVLISAVATAHSSPSLLVAGEFWGGAEEYVEQAGGLGLGERCTFETGYLAMGELPAIVAGCDALVVPYRTGTGSQHPRVAHLHGRPVVATRVGDLPLQIRHGVDGLLCEPDDVGALAAAIDELYRPGVLERLTAGVKPPNVDAEWQTYLDAVLGTAT
jgi:glycosyltransferase involved in cell wall biosynthesis